MRLVLLRLKAHLKGMQLQFTCTQQYSQAGSFIAEGWSLTLGVQKSVIMGLKLACMDPLGVS